MKLFSIKRLIGLGAVYAAVQYARRHGGAKNAFNELLGKAKEKMSEARDLASETKDSVAQDADFASGSGGYSAEERIGGANAYGGYASDPNGRRGY